MPGKASLTPDAVLKAIEEYDQKGRRAFLREYGFKGARDYFLVHNGRRYDSKAIAAVAHRYMSTGRALTASEILGGKGDAARKLEALGFAVSKPAENPDWTWDEHVLALETYFELRDKRFGKSDGRVTALSALLRAAGARNWLNTTDQFRNTNGVYMKLMNFRRFDPKIRASGHVGLRQGSKTEEAVWLQFAGDVDSLRRTAQLIRSLWALEPSEPLNGHPDVGAEEGSVVLRLHKFRERDQRLTAKKKADVIAQKGILACEVCDLVFGEKYGTHGDGFIEVHHTQPLALSEPGRKTRIADLACVCSNCHRMLHKGGLRSIDWLREIIGAHPPSELSMT
jgi:5-methylcytosine-specific restriction protein A